MLIYSLEMNRLSKIIDKKMKEIENESKQKYLLTEDILFEGKKVAEKGTIGIYETVGRYKQPPYGRYRFGNYLVLESDVINDKIFQKC